MLCLCKLFVWVSTIILLTECNDYIHTHTLIAVGYGNGYVWGLVIAIAKATAMIDNF